jgi:hypothetical protein
MPGGKLGLKVEGGGGRTVEKVKKRKRGGKRQSRERTCFSEATRTSLTPALIF